MKFNKAMIAASAVTMTLGLAACDGPKEDAMEEAGEERAEVVDEQTDALESGDVITEEREDAIDAAAEDRADTMEQVGEAIDTKNAQQ